MTKHLLLPRILSVSYGLSALLWNTVDTQVQDGLWQRHALLYTLSESCRLGRR